MAVSISDRFPQFHVGVPAGQGGLCEQFTLRQTPRIVVFDRQSAYRYVLFLSAVVFGVFLTNRIPSSFPTAEQKQMEGAVLETPPLRLRHFVMALLTGSIFFRQHLITQNR